ncbi:MAG: hypothetical protein RBU37_25515, partial [Myxococcota bacterium]|nr:hypothetical protein [Myxococcota bacterium]
MRAIESFTVAALLLGSLALPGLAMAQEGRVFIRFAGDKKTAQTLEEGSTRFISVVTESGEVAFAGSSDRDSIYAECRDDVGVSREVERECQLMAARRVFVEHLLVVEASQLEKGLWELTLSVWNPDDNARVHVSYEEVEAKTLDVAAREAYPQLALKYL